MATLTIACFPSPAGPVATNTGTYALSKFPTTHVYTVANVNSAFVPRITEAGLPK